MRRRGLAVLRMAEECAGLGDGSLRVSYSSLGGCGGFADKTSRCVGCLRPRHGASAMSIATSLCAGWAMAAMVPAPSASLCDTSHTESVVVAGRILPHRNGIRRPKICSKPAVRQCRSSTLLGAFRMRVR